MSATYSNFMEDSHERADEAWNMACLLDHAAPTLSATVGMAFPARINALYATGQFSFPEAVTLLVEHEHRSRA